MKAPLLKSMGKTGKSHPNYHGGMNANEVTSKNILEKMAMAMCKRIINILYQHPIKAVKRWKMSFIKMAKMAIKQIKPEVFFGNLEV